MEYRISLCITYKPWVLWLWFFQSRHRFLSSCRSSSSVIALLVVWSDHLSMCKNLRSFVEASDGLWYTNNQIVWDRCPISYFFGKIWPFFANFFGKKLLFWHRTFAVVLGIRLIRRRWKGCRFWGVPFTVCYGFSNHDTGSSCHSSSSVIALLVFWSDHLSVYKDLRSFVEACDKFRRSLGWIAIHKKLKLSWMVVLFPNFLGKLDLFCHFLGNNRGFGWLFLDRKSVV